MARIVKRRAAAVGLDPERYAGHSLRAGLATIMPAGTPEPVIVATLRLMRRRWLERYGDDPFFAED